MFSRLCDYCVQSSFSPRCSHILTEFEYAFWQDHSWPSSHSSDTTRNQIFCVCVENLADISQINYVKVVVINNVIIHAPHTSHFSCHHIKIWYYFWGFYSEIGLAEDVSLLSALLIGCCCHHTACDWMLASFIWDEVKFYRYCLALFISDSVSTKQPRTSFIYSWC